MRRIIIEKEIMTELKKGIEEVQNKYRLLELYYRKELEKDLEKQIKELEMISKEVENLFKQCHWSAKDKEKALEVLEKLRKIKELKND